jgi:adenylate cyclase
VPEALLSQAIGTWFLRVGQIVQQQGSWAQKYIGDAVMSVWVHQNEASMREDILRVLWSVGAIDAATAGMHLDLPLPGPLRIGAGINTGPAIIGGVDYAALGDTVNAAFRLEAATRHLGLEVAAGERTHAALDPELQSRFERRRVALKGYEGESTAWAISFDSLRAGLQ